MNPEEWSFTPSMASTALRSRALKPVVVSWMERPRTVLASQFAPLLTIFLLPLRPSKLPPAMYLDPTATSAPPSMASTRGFTFSGGCCRSESIWTKTVGWMVSMARRNPSMYAVPSPIFPSLSRRCT